MITQLGSHDHTHLGLNEHPLLGSHDHPLLGSRHSRQSLKWASGEQQVDLDEHSSECPPLGSVFGNGFSSWPSQVICQLHAQMPTQRAASLQMTLPSVPLMSSF